MPNFSCGTLLHTVCGIDGENKAMRQSIDNQYHSFNIISWITDYRDENLSAGKELYMDFELSRCQFAFECELTAIVHEFDNMPLNGKRYGTVPTVGHCLG